MTSVSRGLIVQEKMGRVSNVLLSRTPYQSGSQILIQGGFSFLFRFFMADVSISPSVEYIHLGKVAQTVHEPESRIHQYGTYAKRTPSYPDFENVANPAASVGRRGPKLEVFRYLQMLCSLHSLILLSFR